MKRNGPRVKFCGITSLADARIAARLGADYLGFNFCRQSPRYIAPARARRIIVRLPRRVVSVGVFVDAPAQEVRELARDIGLRVVQLHGSESPRVVRELSKDVAVWKAVRVRAPFRAEALKKYKDAQAILLDAFRRGKRGGTGKTFAWKLARRAKLHARIILAGGLTPENVAEAVRTVRPFAVDVASGIESKPGKKDARKMRAFMREVKTAK